ncbi:MAG: M14 family metallopeptidase [Candidatus Aminicenantes bacterium]|nr:M14 family metallopeptidase [Candidatus Aminicenantes bacterium]
MFKKIVFIGLILLATAYPIAAEIGSLSQVFLLGHGVKDTDGDGWADRVAVTIVIPDSPTAAELILAADIAARANLESLAQDPSLVKRESEISNITEVESPILIGPNIKWLKQAVHDGVVVIPALETGQGFISTFKSKTQNGIILTAGSEDALLRAGRAFFLRWPYFWDIWGRETGPTYDTLEHDITAYLKTEGISLQMTFIRSVLYEFPNLKNSPGALKKLDFGAGEVKDLGVEIYFTDDEDQARSFRALEALHAHHQRGEKSGILSYAGCARLTFSLRYGKSVQTAFVSRLGRPKRMLTPGFKTPPRFDGAGHEFDLLNLFTTKGIYGDLNEDMIPDTVDGRIIVPSSGAVRGVAPLASRLVLQTAGAMFPLVFLDSEIEFRKNIVAPILVGANTLTQELQRVGKLVLPALENASGLIRVVPRAFNKSSALVVTAADNLGLEKTLGYLSSTFPYFNEPEDGRPQLADAAADLERFFKGEKGAAEAQFALGLKKLLESLQGKDLESFTADLLLPKANPAFEEELKKTAGATVNAPALEIRADVLKGSKRIFEKEQTFAWEADDALSVVKEKLQTLAAAPAAPIRISLGLSESPEIRARLKSQIEEMAAEILKSSETKVEVFSAYKQGFFWIVENVIPALKGKPVAKLTVKFAAAGDDLGKPKRFYTESVRWLQELYPVDEIIARDLDLPVEAVQFEMKEAGEPVYEIVAQDGKNAVLWTGTFSPRVREIPYLKPLPEWGTAQVTTGWIRLDHGTETLCDTDLPTDLERLWSFFQDEGLAPVYNHVLKKTGGNPVFSKQPYFKQLKVEVWASEPDARLGLDEEVVSSLEAFHDEIYFDTLDFLRGITELDSEDSELPEDTSRFSAPGNVLPVIHPTTPGEPPKIKITFEDWPADAPSLTLAWKERGRDELSKKIAFPELTSKTLSLPALVYNGLEERIDRLIFDLEFEKESDYLGLLDLLASYRDLQGRGLLADSLRYPRLNEIAFSIKCKDMAKEEAVPVSPPEPEPGPAALPNLPADVAIVDTFRILSPEMVEAAVSRLAKFPALRTYVAGRSYENRPVPVIEAYRPFGPNVSIPRLISMKPTLYLSGRQHANEVSSTNYILKLAELLATDKTTKEYVDKINFVLQPMENPDGAALAYTLQALTPFHRLHAGRYSSLGLEIGTLTGAKRPLLPEAAVKRALNAKWFPDIALNLHGYPSHEWVQQFSNYSPYLFRDYWIPRGWFAYVPGLTLPIYDRYKTASEEIRSFIIAEMNADAVLKESNRKFYDRYERWASRWQPHLDYLEKEDGVNLYAKRRSSTENRLTPKNRMTYAEEIPELMDETAHGAWLDFLSTQGLTYIRAHMKYLAQAKFDVVRIEEEVQDRIRIQFYRGRPGTVKK